MTKLSATRNYDYCEFWISQLTGNCELWVMNCELRNSTIITRNCEYEFHKVGDVTVKINFLRSYQTWVTRVLIIIIYQGILIKSLIEQFRSGFSNKFIPQIILLVGTLQQITGANVSW